jgi:cytoskeletal protein RodZ
MQGIKDRRARQKARGAAALLGARLRARREALGLDIAAACVSTGVPRWLIEAMEAGEFARFRAHVTAGGALRSYARLLGLAEGPLLVVIESGEEHVVAPRRLRRPGCFWGRRGHISLFG